MKVLVFGANGQIGKLLVKQLSDSERYTPVAAVRKEEQKNQFESEGVESVIANLEDSIDVLSKAVKGVDAVVFTAGSGGHTGADKTMMIDLDGAVKTMEAAKNTGVSRYIIVSAIGAHKWHEKTVDSESASYYRVAKFYADQWLLNSGLDYTIVRPGKLLNNQGTGKVKVSESLERASIPREDVASAIVSVLENDNTIGKGFDIVSGNTDIETAVGNI